MPRFTIRGALGAAFAIACYTYYTSPSLTPQLQEAHDTQNSQHAQNNVNTSAEHTQYQQGSLLEGQFQNHIAQANLDSQPRAKSPDTNDPYSDFKQTRMTGESSEGRKLIHPRYWLRDENGNMRRPRLL